MTITHILLLVAVLGVVSTVLALLSGLAHAAHRDNLADDLEIAHEALDVFAQVGAEVAKGTPLDEAIKKAGASEDAQALLRRFKAFAHLSVLLLAFCFFAGCSAEQLAHEEALAHAALVRLDASIDWVNANPATVNALLDDAAKASSDPAFQKAVTKAKDAVAKGDAAQAQTVVALAAALTAPPPPKPEGGP